MRKPRDFLEARDEDALMTPFECDLCIFRKMRRRNLNFKRQQDKFLLLLIRRENVDAFWSSKINGISKSSKDQVNV